ncbi:response regulator [bacterium]|nr:response regulator [bacterium]
MGIEDKGSIINFFIDEMSEHLDEVTESLLHLESNYDPEIIHKIFRIAHTMKGSSAMMGFSIIARISHKFEDILGEVRSENRVLTPELVDHFFTVMDSIKSALTSISEGIPEEDILELTEIEETLDKVEFFQEEIQEKIIEIEEVEPQTEHLTQDKTGVVGRLEELAKGFKGSRIKSERAISNVDFQKDFNLYANELTIHSEKLISNLGKIIDSDGKNLDLIDSCFVKLGRHISLMCEISETYSFSSLSEVFIRYSALLKQIIEDSGSNDKEVLFFFKDIFIELNKRLEIFKARCSRNDIMKIVSFLLAAFPEKYRDILLLKINKEQKLSFPIKELISDLTTGFKIDSKVDMEVELDIAENNPAISVSEVEMKPLNQKEEKNIKITESENKEKPDKTEEISESKACSAASTSVTDWFSVKTAGDPINKQFLDFFVEEANDCVEYIEKNIDATVNFEMAVDQMEDLIRNSHTIKGSSAMVGLKRISSIGKSMEFILREVHAKQHSFNLSQLNIFKIGLKGIELLLSESKEKGYEETDVSKVIDSFSNFFELADNEIVEFGVVEKSINIPDKSPTPAPVPEPEIEKKTVLEESKKISIPKKALQSEIQKEKKIESEPVKKEIKKRSEKVRAPQHEKQISVPVMVLSEKPEKAKPKVEAKTQDRRADNERREPKDRRLEFGGRRTKDEISKTVRVGIEKLDNLINLVGELVINKIRLDQRLGHLTTLVTNLHSQEKHLQKVGRNLEMLSELFEELPKEYHRGGYSEEGIQEFSTFDEVKVDLVSIMSQLIEISTQFTELSDDLNITTLRIGKITVDLQENIMKVRMFPVDRVFQQFPRVVRDLSRKTGKKMQLEMSGEETELDKTVIEKIGDPLMHLVRNSIDHGIESPSERVLLGKSESGTIKLSAFHKGNNIIIEIEDDGRGLEIEKIKTSAIAKGIISEREVNQLTKKEIMNLIFLPGFSTSKSVTDISGRGVGMDVVRSNINELKGTIELNSKPGKGTKIAVKLPLTLAIIQALIVETNGEDYVIPINSVVETTIVYKNEVKMVGESRVFFSRNEYIPIISLADVLGHQSIQNDKAKSVVVVVTSGEQILGLEVDILKGKHEIVVKNLGHYLKKIKNIASATILGDGRVLLILDISSIAQTYTGSGKRRTPLVEQNMFSGKEVKKIYSVLVVDDSPTVRNIEKNILEGDGYRVVCAENGFEGYEKLSYENIDIVITDVEMPKMNGFEFTSKIRASSRFKDMPIIIITTKINDEDKRKGLNLGANLYLGKPFEQDNMLIAVKRLIGIEL